MNLLSKTAMEKYGQNQGDCRSLQPKLEVRYHPSDMQVRADQDTLQLHKAPPHFKNQLLIFMLYIHLTLDFFLIT